MARYILIAGFLFSLLAACQTTDWEAEMMRFDRAFIPVWYYVEMQDLPQAELALAHLEVEWQAFKMRPTPPAPYRQVWKQLLTRVDAWLLTTADALTQSDQMLTLTQLDHARYELTEWRRHQDTNYFLDAVWDLEAAIDIARSLLPPTETEVQEYQRYQQAIADIYINWQELRRRQDEAFLFDQETDRGQSLRLRSLELNLLVEAYVTEAHCLDNCAYEEATESLHFAFLHYLKTFGDFSQSPKINTDTTFLSILH